MSFKMAVMLKESAVSEEFEKGPGWSPVSSVLGQIGAHR